MPGNVSSALVSTGNVVGSGTLSMDEKELRVQALHTQWRKEDVDHIVKGEELVRRQRQSWKELGLIIFGYTLHEEQVDAIWTLCYEHKDLLLLAKTGFGKSMIFSAPIFDGLSLWRCHYLHAFKTPPSRAKCTDKSNTKWQGNSTDWRQQQPINDCRE